MAGVVASHLVGNVYSAHVLVIVVKKSGNWEELFVFVVCEGLPSSTCISTCFFGLLLLAGGELMKVVNCS